MKLIAYADPGHAWLKVPFKLICKLGIQDKITSFSYIRRDKSGNINYVYLEEDCDWAAFASAFNGTIDFDIRHSNKSSKIRSYEPYSAKG